MVAFGTKNAQSAIYCVFYMMCNMCPRPKFKLGKIETKLKNSKEFV